MKSPSNDQIPAHKRLMDLFQEIWSEEQSLGDIGRLLFALGHCLGRTIVELYDRGVDWEIIDRNVTKAMLRGVDAATKEDP